jgi:hypothetical protein
VVSGEEKSLGVLVAEPVEVGDVSTEKKVF